MVTYFGRGFGCVLLAALAAGACGKDRNNTFIGDAGLDGGDANGGAGGSGGSQAGAGGGGGGDASVGCTSDEQCSGTRPVCDPASGVCGQCRTDTDCGTDAECRDATCVAISRCTNSLDCAVGDVCDVESQRCVDCLTAVDCDEGELCVETLCRATCDSDLDCTPLGLLCDRTNGYCVRCLRHVDCPEVQFCQAGACVNDVCRPGVTACQGNGTATCGPDGDAYEAPTPCPLGQLCVASAGSATCEATGDDVLLIDDMEDGDQRIANVAGRRGYWWAHNDGSGEQFPSTTETYLPELLTLPRAASTRAIHASGGGFLSWGALVMLDLNNAATGIGGGLGSPGIYDVRGYNGITFYARGSGVLRVEVRTTTTMVVAEGGTCTTGCNDHYGKTFPALTSTWNSYTMSWSEVQQRGFVGATGIWSPETTIGLQFLPMSFTSFDFWIDDVRFY
jgi:hypothetical protein